MLIVEDQDVMRRSLCEFLQAAYPDSSILEAATARQALEQCHKHRPRLVLMDVQLPDGNGIELTAKVKALLPETIVIVVSQHAAQTYVERALAAGAFAYLTKDKIHRELLQTIASALRSRQPVPGAEGIP